MAKRPGVARNESGQTAEVGTRIKWTLVQFKGKKSCDREVDSIVIAVSGNQVMVEFTYPGMLVSFPRWLEADEWRV